MSDRAEPELVGLVVAGGESRRMRRDKGALDYRGLPQVAYCHRLLAGICDRVLVSVNAGQAAREPYRGLPLVRDAGDIRGPAAGLLAAWSAAPDVSLLALAVDLPFVDGALLETLAAHRNPDRDATAFAHPDGVLEPLCAIWEARLRPRLVEARATGPGSPSLRRLLESADVERIAPADPRQIVSVNTEQGFRQALAALGRSCGKLDADAD